MTRHRTRTILPLLGETCEDATRSSGTREPDQRAFVPRCEREGSALPAALTSVVLGTRLPQIFFIATMCVGTFLMGLGLCELLRIYASSNAKYQVRVPIECSRAAGLENRITGTWGWGMTSTDVFAAPILTKDARRCGLTALTAHEFFSPKHRRIISIIYESCAICCSPCSRLLLPCSLHS